jgi:branched-chain amino acid aminotransferase
VSETHPTYLWWNGERRNWNDATVHITELGWSTVGAVFEGIRAYWNADQEELYIFQLREHLERLERSMKLVRLPFIYSVESLTDAILDLLRANESAEDTYIYPMAYTQDSYHHRFDKPDQAAALVIHTKPMASHLGTGIAYKARVSSWRRISEDVMPPRVKNLSNYRNGQLARLEALADGYDTAFLLNSQGKVAEAPGACVMHVRGGKLVTPDLQSSVLESITREALIVLAREQLGLIVEERPVDRTELYVADEVFICGTAAEITPIVSIDHYAVGNGKIGPITAQLDRLYNAVLRGAEGNYLEWRTPVGVRSKVSA